MITNAKRETNDRKVIVARNKSRALWEVSEKMNRKKIWKEN